MSDNKITVGISIGSTQNANIWNSGATQNIAFLAMLLSRIPRVGKVVLLNGGESDQLPASLRFDALNLPLVRPHEVTYDIDLVIEMGVSLSLEWLRHIRALGAKIVTLFVGHNFAGQAETAIFGTTGGAAFIGTPWHEIWTLPHHMHASAPLLRTVGRVRVHEVPYLWSPIFLDQNVKDLNANGLSFGFDAVGTRRGTQGWRMAIFEPNISVVKSCFIPMLVCESAYRNNRAAVDFMMVMNTFFMKDHPTFNHFASHLDLTRDSRASYEPRVAFAECMAVNRIDAVVAHQWECGLNNAYFDALYGGYPLIHNSEFLQASGAGLYYPGFDAIQGGTVLLDAWAAAPDFWTDYHNRSRAYLETLAPAHEPNVAAFAQRIGALMQEPA